MILRRLCVLLLLFLACVPAHAKTAEELRAVEKQMEEKKQQQDTLDQQAQAASKNLDDLRDKLIRSTSSLQDKENEEESLADRLDDLTGEIAAKSKNAVQDRKRLSVMLSALIEVASRPPATLFMQKEITRDHIHRALLLHAVLPGLKEQAESAARDVAELYDLQERLAKQKKLLSEAQENLQQQKQSLDQLIAARQGFLQRTEEQKADIARHLSDLSNEAQNLHQLMEKVSPEKHADAKPGPGDVALKWPVSGAVRKHFGDRDNDGVTAEGLTLSAPSGAPIVAPRAGKVVFAGAFRGYGQIMILQHAGGYHSFLAGFGRIDAEVGQEVAAGEPLGALPAKPGSHPELYFEWRKGEEPVNPVGGLSMKQL